jgi:hypothetical protein
VNFSHIPKFEILRCDTGQFGQVPRRNKNMERSEGQALGARCRRLGPPAKPTHGELQEIGIQMGWALSGCGKAKIGAYCLLDFQGRMLEHSNMENLHHFFI